MKEKQKAKKKGTTQAHAHLMTGTENLNALAEKDFMKYWKDMMKELAPIVHMEEDQQLLQGHCSDSGSSTKGHMGQRMWWAAGMWW